MDLNELNPRQSKFKIKDKEFTMKKFSLGKRIQMAREFESKDGKEDGLDVLQSHFLNYNYRGIAKFVFLMLHPGDKKKFKDEIDFLDSFSNEMEFLRTCLIPCNQCIGSSQPEMEREMEEIKKQVRSEGPPRSTSGRYMIPLQADTHTQ